MKQLKPQNETEAFFLRLRKSLKPYKIEYRQDSDVEFFDLKDGTIIVREDGGMFDNIYTIVRNLSFVKGEEARKILKQLTGMEPPKTLDCEYSTMTKVHAAALSVETPSETDFDSFPHKEKIITSKRDYPDILIGYGSQPTKKQIEKSLADFEENFGLRFLYKKQLKCQKLQD